MLSRNGGQLLIAQIKEACVGANVGRMESLQVNLKLPTGKSCSLCIAAIVAHLLLLLLLFLLSLYTKT